MLKFDNSTSNSITITINNTQTPAILIIRVIYQDQLLQTHELEAPFPSSYTIHRLRHQTMYQLKARLEIGQTNQFQTLHVNTSGDANMVLQEQFEEQEENDIRQKDQTYALSEQKLIEVLKEESQGIGVFKSKKEIGRIVQNARQNSNQKGFIASEYRVNRPPHLKEERFKRVWMVSKAQELYDEVYGNTELGQQYLRNDWFMGPFYSYDVNCKNLQRKKNRQDLQI